MSKAGLCCDECFSKIARKSTKAAMTWLDLCEIQDTCRLFAIIMTDNKEFQLLEHLGFITTTDSKNMIVCKVHGKRTDVKGSYFCKGNCGNE
jgi:hypothetical protein